MRPVDKGESPYKEIKEYQAALPYLEKKIGLYCSYCEMPINHVPEVEHMISKKHGGDKTAWSNLLLGCKYCNSRKSARLFMARCGKYSNCLFLYKWNPKCKCRGSERIRSNRKFV